MVQSSFIKKGNDFEFCLQERCLGNMYLQDRPKLFWHEQTHFLNIFSNSFSQHWNLPNKYL